MKNYIQSGDIITASAPRDVKSGELVAIGALVGVAQADADLGQPVALVTRGVFDIAVAADAPVAVGDVVYIDGQMPTTDDATGTNPRIGIAVSEAAPVAGDAAIRVRLT